MRFLRQPYTWVLPNIFVGDYERDVCMVNQQSGYWNEYEIKISVADFKKDFTKRSKNINMGLWNREKKWEQLTSNKHDNFLKFAANQETKTPNRFLFVVPKNLIDRESVPPYAGLLYYDEESKSISVVKSGKLLHKNKIEQSLKEYILDKAYDRYTYMLNEMKRTKVTNTKLNIELGYYYDYAESIQQALAQ